MNGLGESTNRKSGRRRPEIVQEKGLAWVVEPERMRKGPKGRNS